MKRVLLFLNSILIAGIMTNAAVLAGPQCPASSACPGDTEDCDQYIYEEYWICQNYSGGCCQWWKIMYHYTNQPGHNCSQGPCGQWNGDPPAAGQQHSGKICSGGSGMVQGICVTE